MRFAHHQMTWESWARKQQQPFDLDEMFSKVKAAGYDGIELGGDEKTLGTPDQLKRKLADHGLEVAAFGSSVTANPWPPNTESYRREMDYAAELGVKTIAVCGGFVPEQRRTMFESDYALFAENMAAACEYGQSKGRVVSFHPHVGCLVETIAEVQRLWHYLPDLPLCVDTAHLAAVRSDPIELIEMKPQSVAHLHVKDWNAHKRRFVDLGQGDQGLDFVQLLQVLERINYTGWLTVELDDPQTPPEELARGSRQFLATCERALTER